MTTVFSTMEGYQSVLTVKNVNHGRACGHIIQISTPTSRNYCRNPQGYGSSPWCYTDMKTREVSTCPVPRCGKELLSRGTKYELFTVLICLFVIVGVVISIVLLRNKCVVDRRRGDIEEPYSVYRLNYSEQIERLLKNDVLEEEATST